MGEVYFPHGFFRKGDSTVTGSAGHKAPAIKVKNKGFFRTLWGQKQLMLMSVPMLLYVFLFNYYPMWGWIAAFEDYKPKDGPLGSKWIGMQHFEWLFGREEFLEGIRNTLAMSIINLIVGTLASILLAILLNEVRNKLFKRTVQTVTYLPHFLSMVIVVGMAQNIFASTGPVNALVQAMGGEPIFWLGEEKLFWWLVAVINVWKEVGWNSIIYISTMTSIDPTLYEAASIDGAGRFQRIMNVTLPGIKSTFMVLLIMNIGHLMEAGFEIQYLMGNSQVEHYSRTIDVFVLEYGISNNNFGRATAAGMFKSIVAIILLFSANWVAKKLDEDTLI